MKLENSLEWENREGEESTFTTLSSSCPRNSQVIFVSQEMNDKSTQINCIHHLQCGISTGWYLGEERACVQLHLNVVAYFTASRGGHSLRCASQVIWLLSKLHL